MQFPGRFQPFSAISTHRCHIQIALSETHAAVTLEAPHSLETQDSGDYRRAAHSGFGASSQIEVAKMS